MIPRILEYEDGRIVITAEAYSIPELKAIIEKHDMKAEPYLAYVHLMTAPDSPYINYPEDEKLEQIVFDVIQSHGDFDIEDELIPPAIEKLLTMYTSTLVRHYEGVKILMDKFTKYIKDEDIKEGKDGNMNELMRILKDAALNMRSFRDLEKQVDEEIKTKMRGKNVLGDY